MLARFGHGFAALARALPFAFEDRRLRWLTLAPGALALALTVVAALTVYHYAHLLVSRHSNWVVLWWIGLFLAVTVGTWLAWIVACLVATAPFADALAARSEELCGAPHPAKTTPLQSLLGIGQTILLVLIYAGIAGPLLVLQLAVPLLSPVIAALGMMVTAQFLAYDLFEPSLRGLAFGEKWRRVRRPEALGLGLAAALASALPLLGVLVAPLGVVAAARLCAEG
jgi:uncharacterized protein involved in cysteine biosynthesis